MAKTPAAADPKPVDGGLPDQELRETAPPPAILDKSGLPAEFMDDAVSMSGAGISDNAADASTPFLVVLQKGSPEVNKMEPSYIDGAEAGDLMHSITKKLWKQAQGGPLVLQAYFQKNEVEWTPRSAGGGYVATHPEDTTLKEKVRLTPAPGGGKRMMRMIEGRTTQLVETNYHFLVLVDDLDLAVLGVSSTGLGFSRRWTGAMKANRVRGPSGPVIPPSFSRVYRLRTVYQKNDSGDWFGLVHEDLGWVDIKNPDQKYAYDLAKQQFLLARERGGIQMGRPPETTAEPVGEDNAPL